MSVWRRNFHKFSYHAGRCWGWVRCTAITAACNLSQKVKQRDRAQRSLDKTLQTQEGGRARGSEAELLGANEGMRAGTEAVIPPLSPLRHPSAELGSVGTRVEVITPALLAATPIAIQKHLVGDKQCPAVKRHVPQFAKEITGMLLGKDNSEILSLLQSDELLVRSIDEAMQIRAMAASASQAKLVHELESLVCRGTSVHGSDRPDQIIGRSRSASNLDHLLRPSIEWALMGRRASQPALH